MDFNQIMEKLTLSEKHRAELKVKRGFTDDVIDKMGFKSCGPEIANDPFFDDYPEFRKSFYYENIVIPYKLNDAYIHVRPHKFGISGLSIQPYIPLDLFPDEVTDLVIAESEFKAVASCMLGVPAIGIPGIASMSRSHLPKLIDAIKLINPKNIFIIFDTENKSNPELPNYKPDFRNRYDTEFYSFVMARSIETITKIKTRICQLPKIWMVNGKADIDGCLALGMKTSEYKEVVSSGVTALEYKKSWDIPNAHLSFLNRRIERFFYDGPVFEIDNCYYVERKREDVTTKQRVSNFVIKMIHTINDENNICQRYCQIISSYGNSGAVTVTPDCMSSKTAFLRFCYENGDYEFSGTDDDLRKIWAYIFLHQDGLKVEQLSYYGYNADCKAWFFNDGAYYKSKYHKADKGIVWLDDHGYKIEDFGGDDDSGSLIPSICQDQPLFTLNDVLEALSHVMSENHARVLIGWALGCYFLPEIIETYKVYPFLFLYGTMGAGKSVTSGWISSFFGIPVGEKGVPFSGSTVAGISRMATKLSMLPIWLEEYRNGDKSVAEKNNYLRSIYDGSTIVKGTRDPRKIVKYTARATLVISGEEYPQDAALNTRCIQLPIYGKDRGKRSQEKYRWLQEHKSFFSYFGHNVLMNKEKLWPIVKSNIDGYLEAIEGETHKKAVTNRTKFHVSIVSGIVDALLGQSDSYMEFVGKMIDTIDNKRQSEQAITIFFEDLRNLKNSGKFHDGNTALSVKTFSVAGGRKRKVGMFDFSLAYSIWEREFKGLRNALPISKRAIEEHISREYYFMKYSRSRDIGATARKKVMMLEFDSMPDDLKFLISTEDRRKLDNDDFLNNISEVEGDDDENLEDTGT